MFHRNYVHKSNVVGAGIVAFLAGIAAWEIFGKSVKDKVSSTGQFRDIKKQVYDRASKISDLTQEKYDEIVDDVTNKYAQAKGISQNELADLVDDLKWHWKRIKSSWENNRY